MKTPLSLAVWMLVLLTGCAGMNSDYTYDNYHIKPQATPQQMGNGRRLESIPDAEHPCAPANVYFINEAKGVRQLVIDWDKLSERSAYTLPRKGRDDLIKRIQKAGQGCPMPALVESIYDKDTRVRVENHFDTYAFVRYWLDGEVIHLKVHQFIFNTDLQTGQIKSDPQGMSRKLTDIDPQTGRMRPQQDGFTFDRWKDLNTSWGYDPYNGPIATPQVAYRIDKHRYFEIVPYKESPCGDARLFYNDTAKGIRTNVMDARYGSGTFIIDATNDQYLVAPILNSSSGCQSGGGDKCASRMYYSQDKGRTWQVTKPSLTEAGGDIHLIGDTVFYAGQRAKLSALATGDSAWTEFYLIGKNVLPPIRKRPIDTEFNCNSDDKE